MLTGKPDRRPGFLSEVVVVGTKIILNNSGKIQNICFHDNPFFER